MNSSPSPSRTALNRRQFIRAAGLLGLASWWGRPQAWAEDTATLPFQNGERRLVRYPQKRPLSRVTTRPPQLETPFSVFNEGVITPNDAFFVRYHLAPAPPANIDADTFRLKVQGKVKTPSEFSLAELKSKFEPVEMVAVNQC